MTEAEERVIAHQKNDQDIAEACILMDGEDSDGMSLAMMLFAQRVALRDDKHSQLLCRLIRIGYMAVAESIWKQNNPDDEVQP